MWLQRVSLEDWAKISGLGQSHPYQSLCSGWQGWMNNEPWPRWHCVSWGGAVGRKKFLCSQQSSLMWGHKQTPLSAKAAEQGVWGSDSAGRSQHTAQIYWIMMSSPVRMALGCHGEIIIYLTHLRSHISDKLASDQWSVIGFVMSQSLSNRQK